MVAIDAAGALNGLLYAAPLLLIGGLLVCQRFLGEERIIARHRTAPRVRLRPAKRRWAHQAERALSCALERAPWSLRGPPAAVTA
jgi:hypothetical protein